MKFISPTRVSSLFPRDIRQWGGVAIALLLIFSFTREQAAAQAFNPLVNKLHGRATTPQDGNGFGRSVAVSDRWLLVGEEYNDDVAVNAGAAHLYDARTGRYLRKLVATDGQGADFLGNAVALSGNLAVVGAANHRAVYGFDARTGRQLWKLQGSGFFGYAVALSGDRLLVGDIYAEDNGQSGGGKAYVYDTSTTPPTLLQTLGREGDAVFNGFFGGSVALCGHFAVVGHALSFSTPGFAYLFDTETGARLQSWPGDTIGDGVAVAIDAGRVLVSDSTTGEVRVYDAVTGVEASYSPLATPSIGEGQISVSGNLALIGQPGANGNAGNALIFDLISGQEIAGVESPDGEAGDSFGESVALCGNRALVGARYDDDVAVDGGGAYYFRSVNGPLSLQTAGKKGDFAPGAVGADFTAFWDAFLNDDGEAVYSAKLSNGKKGIFAGRAGMVLSKGLPDTGVPGLGGAQIASVFSPVVENNDAAIFWAKLKGAGVNGTNNRAILQSDGATLTSLFRTGDAPAELGGGTFQIFTEVVQQSDTGRVAAAYRLRRGPGGVTAANDSGVFAVDNTGAVLTSVMSGSRNREGEPAIGGGGDYGQFLGRAAYTNDSSSSEFFYFPAYMLFTGESKPRQALFYDSDGSSGSVIAQGAAAPGLGGPLVNTLLGETVQRSYGAYRATLKGPGVTGASNEGIFSELGTFAALRKGQVPDLANEPKVVVSRFLGFWLLDGGDSVMVLAKLRGPGVNPANDCALYLINDTGNFIQELVREGDVVCGCDGPRLGTIQRVDVDTKNGNYVILGSLRSAAVSNQAIFTGNVIAGDDMALAPLRQPMLKIRKGTAYQAYFGETTTIRSLVLPVTTDRGGAGAKGLGQVINARGEISVCVQFTNRAKEVMTGKP
ncbi:MAG: hypothetical protein KDN20_02295 [Verrucomicrobiae bacterium]|nr:hypothetical protein [Verrucomicrobiae bacterium]